MKKQESTPKVIVGTVKKSIGNRFPMISKEGEPTFG